MHQQRLFQSALILVGTAAFAQSAGAANWLQFGYDQAHSGNNASENGYSTATGNALVYSVALTSSVDSAPIYLSNVVTANGTKNLIYTVTKNGNLLALDAGTGTAVWNHQPTSTGGNLTTGSPAVDPSFAYVYAYGLDGKVHRYAAGTGVEFTTNGWPEVSTIKTSVEKGASGLAIATAQSGVTYLYSAIDGYIGDAGDYQGHITAINLTPGQATFAQNVFNSQCSNLTTHLALTTNGNGPNDCPQIGGGNSGIWGRPGTIYNAATDRIYIATGNGLFDPANVQGNGQDWGDSLLALNPDGTGSNGKPLANYTPASFANLKGNDADLGSTAMAILPTPAGSKYPNLAVIGGKDGCMRLLNLDGMSTLATTAASGSASGEIQSISIPSSANHCSDGGNGDNIRTQPVAWVNPADSSTWTFLATNGGVVAYQVTLDGTGNPSLTQKWTDSALASPRGGTSPVIANGTLYYVNSNTVRAVNAVTGALIWSDTTIGSIHWQSPIIVNGHLYVIDSTSKLSMYALDGIFKAGFN